MKLVVNSMMQRAKGAAMNIRRGKIAEIQNKRRPYDLQNAYHSLRASQLADRKALCHRCIVIRALDSKVRTQVCKVRFACMNKRTLGTRVLYRFICLRAHMAAPDRLNH
jgi:hypothetical protein